MFRVEAIVTNPTGHVPDYMSNKYAKIMYDSENGDVLYHNSVLTRDGFRVCSAKTRPIEESEMLNADDFQGNMIVVDGKPVDRH